MILATMLALAIIGQSSTHQTDQGVRPQNQTPWQFAQRRSCKAVFTCEEAVIMWCNGYRRADGDGDGIPCENVCGSLRQVNQIRAAIGC